jgi:hypothetical protein
MSSHTLVLLGDSILDNAPYTRPEPDTSEHLRRLLGGAWRVDLLARDGSTIADVPFQLRELPDPVTCAILSVGGNDAADHIDLLERKASSAAEVLDQLAAIAEHFGTQYDALAREVARRTRRLVLCTIYEPPLFDPASARLARVPLSLLNDRIVRAGAGLGLEVLDLRSVCTQPSDYVKQIEPSPAGAGKIARAIASLLLGQPELGSARVFAA